MKILPKKEYQVIRIKKGLNAKEMADRIGVTRQAVYNFENGANGVSPQLAQKICLVLNVEFDEIFMIED